MTGKTRRYAIQKKKLLKKPWTTVSSEGPRESKATANQNDKPFRIRKKKRTA
jgi:hypothetical protein